MKVTFLGTTTLLFDDGDAQILFDAHVTRPGLGKIAFNRPLDSNADLVKSIKEEYKITRLKGIFVSHSHHDHVLDLINFTKDTDAVIYGSSSTLNLARGGGISEDRMQEFHDDYEAKIGSLKIRVIQSKHSKPNLYNNNLGENIKEPLALPTAFSDFKEGGSYDFYLEDGNRSYIIRPSFNYIKGQFDHLQAQVLFLGIGGMGRAGKKMIDEFFRETVDKIKPELVIPIHHDNFFKGLDAPFTASSQRAIKILEEYCGSKGIQVNVLRPLDGIDI